MAAKLFWSSKTNQAKERRNVSFRTTRPAHFLFKIDSFSKLYDILLEGGVENYESPAFECGGHKWKLSLYPRGNMKLGGDGYISLYLVTSEAGIDSFGADGIYAMFKLFIFDHKRENYFTIQDDEVRNFHSLKKAWGFTRMISRKAFKNVKNGYLVDDCCVFGAEILVIPRVVKSLSFSLIENPYGESYSWTIDKISSLIGETHYSVPYTVHDCQWKLMLRVKRDCVTLSVVLHESLESSKFYVDCLVEFERQNTSFVSASRGWGDVREGLVVMTEALFTGSMTFEVTIRKMSKITLQHSLQMIMFCACNSYV